MSEDPVTPVVEGHLEAYAVHLHEAVAKASSSALLRMLLEREAISQILERAPLAPHQAERLVAIDAKCAEEASRLAEIGRGRWNLWRETLAKKDRGWWWLLDRRDAEPPMPVWLALIAAVAFTATLGLTADAARRFLSGETDLAGIFGALSQGLLTVVAGTTFTTAGRAAITARLHRSHIPPAAWGAVRASIAAAALAVVVVFWLQLPRIGNGYERHAVDAIAAGHHSEAKRLLQRAIALGPGSAGTYYELGAAYERLFQNDAALASYEQAVGLDNDYVLAQNSLARLYLLQGKEPARALEVLNAAFRSLEKHQVPREAVALRPELHKNRAWAYLQLGFFTLAERDLEQVSRFAPRDPGCACLRMLLAEARCRDDEILRTAFQCVAAAESSTNREVSVWRNRAKEILATTGGTQRRTKDPFTAIEPCAAASTQMPTGNSTAPSVRSDARR